MARRGAESDDRSTRHQATIAAVLLGGVFTAIGAGIGVLRGARGWGIGAIALLTGAIAFIVVRWLTLAIVVGTARGLASFVHPSGASAPYEPTFSAHDAREAAGDVAGAIAAYEETLAREPGNTRALRQAAELCARAGQPERAAELFLEVRRHSAGARDAELYATQRLADLYLGALGDSGRALVELRRLAERFPGTREGEGALAALRRLKAERANERHG